MDWLQAVTSRPKKWMDFEGTKGPTKAVQKDILVYKWAPATKRWYLAARTTANQTQRSKTPIVLLLHKDHFTTVDAKTDKYEKSLPNQQSRNGYFTIHAAGGDMQDDEDPVIDMDPEMDFDDLMGLHDGNATATSPKGEDQATTLDDDDDFLGIRQADECDDRQQDMKEMVRLLDMREQATEDDDEKTATLGSCGASAYTGPIKQTFYAPPKPSTTTSTVTMKPPHRGGTDDEADKTDDDDDHFLERL
jgi:hypothetical protein